MSSLLDWFVGGVDYTYHSLFHCLDNDYLVISLVLLLCFSVFTGYLIIAYRWSMAAREAPDTDAKKALNDMKWIFVFCGLCGYAWVCMEAVWPAWRLYAVFLFALNFFTWRYVLRIYALEGVYVHLRDKAQLVAQIESQGAEIKRLRKELSERVE